MSSGNIFYYDMALMNPLPAPILAEITEQRESDILKTPNEWEMSIVRFNLSSELVPIFFPVIPDPVLFPVRTDMSITLQYLGNFFREFVNASPDEVKNGVFDYSDWLNHVNDASILAFTALKAAFPGASGTEAPRFYLNDVTSLISCYTQDLYLITNPNRIQIAINQPLQQLLDMPCINRFSVPDPNGFEYEISINGSASLVPAPPRVGYPFGLNGLAGVLIQTSQEFRSLDEWSTIRAIVFTSQAIPVVKEFVPNLVTQFQNNNVNNSSKPIVTDFLVARDSVEPTRHTFTYIPTAEYRMLSLQGVKSFSSIDIKASYQTMDGRVRDVMIGKGGGMTLKIMFRRIIKL